MPTTTTGLARQRKPRHNDGGDTIDHAKPSSPRHQRSISPASFREKKKTRQLCIRRILKVLTSICVFAGMVINYSADTNTNDPTSALFEKKNSFTKQAEKGAIMVHVTDEIKINNAKPAAETLSRQKFTSSLRSEDDKILSQSCVQLGRGGIFLKHFRKAGGTSLNNIVAKNACRKKKEPENDYIPVYTSELPYFNYTHAFSVHKPSMVFITSVRNPIDRILSLYWFEGRWPRTCARKCEEEKEKSNKTKIIDLQEWIERVHDQKDFPDGRLQLTCHNSCGQWQSVDNYYIRQLLGVDREIDPTKEMAWMDFGAHFKNVTLTRDHLELAKEVLASFDLVVDLENLGMGKDMARMLHALSGGGKRYPKKKTNGSLFIAERSGVEKKKYFIPPTATELDRLRELNALDIELYEYAVELSRDTVGRWIEREEEKSRAGADNIVKTLQQCKRPPLILSNDTKPILLGGQGCVNMERPYFYKGGTCVLHSVLSALHRPIKPSV